MKKLDEMTTQEILKSRFAYDLTSRLTSLPSILFGVLIGNGIVNGNTAMIIGGSIGAAITLGTALFCGGKVEKIDKYFKEKHKQADREYEEIMLKLQNGYKENDIISEDFQEKE